MNKYLFIISYFFGISSFCWGQEGEKIIFDLEGTAEISHISYLKKESEKINHHNEGTLRFQGNVTFNQKLAFKSVFEARKDLQDSYRNRLYLREVFFTISRKKVDLKIGKQIVNWGTADIYNPTDNSNPRDYSDFFDFDNNKLGVWMVHLKYFHDNNHFTELLFSPSLPALAVPNPHSRWVLGLPSKMTNPLDLSIVSPIHYGYTNLRPTFREAGYSIGVKNGYTINGWDVSHSFLASADFSPTFDLRISTIQEREIKALFEPNFQRLYTLGFDFSKAFKKFGLKGEAALKILSSPGDNAQVETAYLEYIIGIEHTFSQLLFQKNLRVLLQWVQQINLENQALASDNVRFFLQKAISLRTELVLNYFSSFTIQTFYNIADKNVYLRPSLKYRILDGWTTTIQGDLLFGKASGFLGQYRNNDRLQLSVTYNF